MKSYYQEQEPRRIPFPHRVNIILPFEGAELTERRAVSEASVDFHDPAAAEMCTLSFAAAEIARYLRKMQEDTEILYTSYEAAEAELQLYLVCRGAGKQECAYTIAPYRGGLVLDGKSRVGTLYAAYHFLRTLGVRWYYPGEEGEIVPAAPDTVELPTSPRTYEPDFSDGRGLDVFAPLKDSAQFLLWMARNRMNIAANHDLTAALGDKLGMTFRIGGHMFEPMLDPDLVLPSGKTIWEEHQDWYGLPMDGVRNKRTARRNQFCMSSPGLCDYLAGEIIARLRGTWRHVDRLDIWGFDNGGGVACQCEGCQRLGNDSDQTLYFLSELRRRIDQAPDVAHVTLVACAYEGTKTMEAPKNPIPENLFAKDCVVFYPIHRCYYHDFDDPACTTNAVYLRQARDWMREKHLPMIMGEYYNVSRYEDLPLVFEERIKKEIPLYRECGFTSITYMHPPLYNWGVRALNHMLMAELSFDCDADADALCEEYFKRLYGKYAEKVKNIYAITEQAGAHVSTYRNWWYSVLATIHYWDGGVPKRELDLTEHFENTDALLASLESEVALRRRALLETEALIKQLKSEEAAPAAAETEAMTPEEARFAQRGNVLMSRLLELRRSFIYAYDELSLFTLVTKDYLLAAEGKDDSAVFEEIEVLYDKMAGYFVPHRYVSREVEAFCDDALTRSQLRAVIDKRRARRAKD